VQGVATPIAAAAAAFQQSMQSGGQELTPEQEQEAIDQAVLEEVMMQSMAPAADGEQTAAAPLPAASVAAPVVDGSLQAVAMEKAKVQSQAAPLPAAATAAPFKPMSRFVRDITFPDGTQVLPGSVFRKIWCVRNDGQCSWPIGTTLANAGGDPLAPADLCEAVPELAPGEERDLAVDLVAPLVTGRHVAYFRLQTPDKKLFGQRFWADVRVVEGEEPAGWQVVSASLSAAAATAPTTANDADATATVDSSAVASAPAMPEQDERAEHDPSAPFAAASADLGGLGDSTASVSSELSMSTASAWVRVWSRELQILRDMGFDNELALLPLLQENCGVPCSISNENHPNSEGMQRVVATLLSRSGHFNSSA